MDAQARSSGTLSCSGSHLSTDSRACFVHLCSRTARYRPRRVFCKAFIDTTQQDPASLKHEQEVCGATRHRLLTEEENRCISISSDGAGISKINQTRQLARAAGFAAVSIAALLHSSEAHAAELLPLDLFSSFLVSMRAIEIPQKSRYGDQQSRQSGLATSWISVPSLTCSSSLSPFMHARL